MELINYFKYVAIIITCIWFLYTHIGIFRRLVAMETSLLHGPYVASEILFPQWKITPMDMDGICKSPKKVVIFLFFLNVIDCVMEVFEVQFPSSSVHQARDVNCIQTFPLCLQSFALPCWETD